MCLGNRAWRSATEASRSLVPGQKENKLLSRTVDVYSTRILFEAQAKTPLGKMERNPLWIGWLGRSRPESVVRVKSKQVEV